MAEHHHHHHSYSDYHHPSYAHAAPSHDLARPESRSPLAQHELQFSLLDGLPSFYYDAPSQNPSDNEHLDNYPPSPPPPSFLDTILNPAGLDHNRFSPFGYRPSPSASHQLHPLPQRGEMPPVTRARPQGSGSSSRAARLPNGYVDLTATPDSPPQRRRRHSPTPGPSAKRRKRDDGSAAKGESSEAPKVEDVDLTDEKKSVQEVLQKQRHDAIKSQAKPEERPTTFNTFNCVICMDMPTDLTATACGHLFCHTCLMEALIAGENRSGPGEPKRSQCPVCRKSINRNKATDIIPLLLKKGLSTQPRKEVLKPASAVAPKVH